MPEEFSEQDFAQAPSEEFSEADFEKQPVIFPSGFSLEQPAPARDSMERAAETAATEAKIFPRPRVRPPGFWETATSPFIPLPKPSEESIRNAPDIQIPGLPTQAQVLGVARSLIKGAESVESPVGLLTLPAAELQALRVPMAIGFGAMGAKQVGQTAGELAGTPNLTPGEKAEKAADILQGAAMTAAPLVAAPAEFARLNRLSKESRDYALYGKTKTPVRDVREPARPEEGARPVPADEGRQEAGPRSGKPPDKTQEAPQPGDATEGQKRLLLTPEQIAEQVGGWKFDKRIEPYKVGNVEVPGGLQFTGTEAGKKTTITIPLDATPEEIAQRLSLKKADFLTADDVFKREPAKLTHSEVMGMPDEEVVKLGTALDKDGKRRYHAQAEGAAWGATQSPDLLPELNRMRREAGEKLIEAQKRMLADQVGGKPPNPADEQAVLAAQVRQNWLGAAVDGLNREGNWFTAVERGLIPPRQAYDALVEKFRAAKPEDKPAIQQQIENLKNKFGGKPPPETEKPPTGTKPPEIATKPEIPATKPPETPSIPEKGSTISAPPPVAETPPETTKAAVAAHSNFTEVGPGKETQTELARHGTPTGLPPGVPDNGPDFPMELMEASRRFGTVVRSRATLPPGVLGMYSRRLAGAKMFDKIEVGDLHNQLTVAHEMGHDLDQLLWPQVNLARTQKSFEARVGSFGTGKEIQGELIPISELMRGPIAGSKGHQAYRRSATELIADYFALYAHDPERARAMAPKFSKGFEAALARVPDADATVKQLHSGNVDPVVPSPGKGPVQQAAEMPGAVPARPEASPWPREAEAAEASQEVVATGTRDLEAAKQKGRVVEDRWRQLVRKQDDRNDVGAAAEGTGNLEKPGDTRDAVISRLTPAKKDLLKRYRFRVEQERGEINNYLKNVTEQEYLAFLPDYFAHFYVNSKTPAGQQAMARFIKSSPNAKQRKIPTLQEAAELGLKPISQDPAVVFTHYVALNWRVATNLKVIDAIGDLRTAAGTPVVLPKGQAPPEYVRTDNPLLQRVYARKGPKGEVHLWRAGVGVHPDVWPALRQMLDAPASSSLGKAWDVFNSITRANAFAFSLFHDLTLRTASVGQQWTWYNPARGLFRIFEHNPVTGELEVFRGARGLGKELMADEKTVVDAAKHGLRFSWTESESYERNARDTLERLAARWRETPYLGKAARIARDLQRFRQEGLWKNTHDAFKILAYEDLTRKALQEAPQGTDLKLVKQRIASALNDAFGGQEWQTKFWLSPQARRVMSRYFLAPDWTFSTLRSIPFASDVVSTLRGNAPRLAGREPIPTRMEGLAGNAQRLRFWGGELAALAMATMAGQYAIYQAFGRKDLGDQPWVWDNEYGQKRRIDVTPIMRQMPWHKADDPTRYYVNLGKRPEEILGWFTHGDSTLYSKLSRPAAEIMRQILGTEGEFKAPWKRDHESFIESLPTRAKEFSGQFFPFVFQGNQFALSLPYRKGMTKYKAQQAYESTYELAANPDAFTGARAFLRGVPNPQGTLDEMVSKITDAAEGNGVNTEPIRQRALSVVRGHWYDEFFKAVDKGDDAKMTRAAEALERLGTTPEGFRESQERRQEMQPVPP